MTRADLVGVDDVAFLRAITDRAAERSGTPPDRAVVTGISNGAFMAHRPALEASDQVAVMAAVAGGLPAALLGTRPTHAVSALLIHGTADMITPIGPGYSRCRGRQVQLPGRTLSLYETAEHWRATNRCPPGDDHTRTTELSTRVTSGGGVGGTQVVAWTVPGRNVRAAKASPSVSTSRGRSRTPAGR